MCGMCMHSSVRMAEYAHAKARGNVRYPAASPSVLLPRRGSPGSKPSNSSVSAPIAVGLQVYVAILNFLQRCSGVKLRSSCLHSDLLSHHLSNPGVERLFFVVFPKD